MDSLDTPPRACHCMTLFSMSLWRYPVLYTITYYQLRRHMALPNVQITSLALKCKEKPTTEKEGPIMSDTTKLDQLPNWTPTKRKLSPKQLSLALKKRRQATRVKEETETASTEVPKISTQVKKKRQSILAKNQHLNIEEPFVMRYDRFSLPEQDELLSHIQTKFGHDAKADLTPFKDIFTAPSVIGVAPSDIDSRIQQMSDVGFTQEEIALLIPGLPYCVEIDFKSLYSLCRLLEKYNIKWRHFLSGESIHCLIQGASSIETVSDL